jgi:hypothetical protein
LLGGSLTAFLDWWAGASPSTLHAEEDTVEQAKTSPALRENDGEYPSITDAGDGTVVMQGVFAGFAGFAADDLHLGPREARVRIPADVLRRAVLNQVLGYRVRINGETVVMHPSDVGLVTSADTPLDSTGLQERAEKAERERDSLARRCALRFEETEKLRAEVEAHEGELGDLRAALSAAETERDRVAELPPLVWAVVVGNYEPAEVLGLYGTREMAEAFIRLQPDSDGPNLQVVSWEVLLPAETVDSATLPVPEPRCRGEQA